MKIYQESFVIPTGGRKIMDITSQGNAIVSKSKIQQGLCNIFLAHTSASLIFCENADPAVRDDLAAFMLRLVPDGDRLFSHNAEGLDDMPAHVRTVLTQNSLNIPLVSGRLALGTWQGIYVWEHRVNSHHRSITVTIMGNG